jgi:hypothetical protein
LPVNFHEALEANAHHTQWSTWLCANARLAIEMRIHQAEKQAGDRFLFPRGDWFAVKL